jgi:hypothetical protein
MIGLGYSVKNGLLIKWADLHGAVATVLATPIVPPT